MSGASVCDDKRIRAAVALLLKAPMLTVAQAMRAAHFTDGESKYRTIQMQVRRALKRKRGDVDMDVNPFLTPPVGVGTSVKLLAKASTHGAKFAVTGGSHIMTNDFLMAACLKEREHQLATLLKDKKARVQKFTVQQRALAILAGKSLESQAIAEYNNLTAAELDILIRYHGAVPKGGKQEKTTKWKAICDKGKKPAPCLPWTEPEEAALLKLQTEEITMGDTHLGRQEQTMRRELLITGANMTDAEWSAFCEQRQRKIDDRNQPPTEGGIGSTDEVEYEEGEEGAV